MTIEDINWMPSGERIPYQMAFQDDYDAFVEYWSQMLKMTREQFVKECTSEKES